MIKSLLDYCGKDIVKEKEIKLVLKEIINYLKNDCNKLIEDLQKSSVKKDSSCFQYLEWKISDHVYKKFNVEYEDWQYSMKLNNSKTE